MKAKIHLFFHRKRYVGTYPKFKKLVFVLFLFVVNAYTWSNVISQYKVDPLINISLASAPLVFENKALAASIPEEEEKVEVKEEVKEVDLVSLIHKLESSEGKNNYSKCEDQGLYNEYGYGIPGNGVYRCFKKGEDRKAVVAWIKDKKAKGMSDAEMLCYYNTGSATKDCKYIKEVTL